MWVSVSFPEGLPAGELSQGGGQVVKPSRSPPEDQVPAIRISSIQSNVLLLDCKIKGVHVTAVVDCGSPICILSDKVFKWGPREGRIQGRGRRRLPAEHLGNSGTRHGLQRD